MILQILISNDHSLRNKCLRLVDIAVGAPFAGKDGRGKVFIYNGNEEGLNQKPSQILNGAWASQAMPSGFGFTLRGDSDVDKNDYPGKSFHRRIHFIHPFSGKRIRLQQLFHKGRGQPQLQSQELLVYDSWMAFLQIWSDKTNTPFPVKRQHQRCKEDLNSYIEHKTCQLWNKKVKPPFTSKSQQSSCDRNGDSLFLKYAILHNLCWPHKHPLCLVKLPK